MTSTDERADRLILGGGRRATIEPAVTTEIVHLVEVAVQGRATVRFALDAGDASDPIAAWLLQAPPYDDVVIDLVLSLLDQAGSSSFLVDVGAHLGTFSLPAAALGHLVLAIEASPKNARLLRTAAAYQELSRLRVVNAYASAEQGQVEFIPFGPWGHRVLPDESAKGVAGVPVPAMAVSDLLARLKSRVPAVVKIDVEGSEMDALAGFGNVLQRPERPALVIESNATALEAHGTSARALTERLTAYGYQLHLVDRQRPRTLVPWGVDDLQTECVADLLATAGAVELPGWRVARPFGPADRFERVLLSSADPVPGNRAFAARLLRSGAVAGSPGEVELALRTLASDEDEDVRRAAAGPHAVVAPETRIGG